MTVVSLLMLLVASPGLAQERPVIAAGDAVILTVADQPRLTNKFVVSSNGTLTLDLVGVIQVDGLTGDQLEADLRRRLAAFLVNPRVRVEVEPARRVFVFGAVPVPGSLELTGNMTLLEALARSGYTGASEVVVVRPQSHGPAPIDAPDAEVIRVNLRELEKDIETGRLSRNVLLRDSDSIYVPADDPNRIYVSGEVRKPGSYSTPDGTTVLQALSLAGGVTEDAALGRLRITRFVDGDLQSLKVSADDAVEAGDTVIVPAKVTLPAIEVGLPTADPQNLPGRIRFGRAIWIRPVVAIKQFGVDSNVFNEEDKRTSDFTIVAGPRLETVLDLDRIDVSVNADLDYVYYRRYTSERSINRATSASVAFAPVDRLRLSAAGRTVDTRDRYDLLLDDRVRRFERTFDIAAQFRPLSKLSVTFSGSDFDRTFGTNDRPVEVVRATLTEHVRSVTSTVKFAVTPLTDLMISGTGATHRFELYPQKNANATEFSIGGAFKTGALVVGDARIGFLSYLGLNALAPDLQTVVGGANLSWGPLEGTRLGLTLERTTGNTFQPSFSYSLIDRAGATLRQGFAKRFDVLLETFREKHTFAQFAELVVPFESVRPPALWEIIQINTAEFGVHVRALRVGLNVSNWQRLAAASGRAYDDVRVMMNVSYGAFEARGRQ